MIKEKFSAPTPRACFGCSRLSQLETRDTKLGTASYDGLDTRRQRPLACAHLIYRSFINGGGHVPRYLESVVGRVADGDSDACSSPELPQSGYQSGDTSCAGGRDRRRRPYDG